MKHLTFEFLHTFIENFHLTTSIVENLLSKNSIQKTITENRCKNPSLQKLPFENLYSLTFHFGNNSCSWKQKCFQKPPFSNTRLFSKTHLSYQKPLHTPHMWNVWKQEPSHESFNSMQKQDMGLNWFCDQFWCKIQFGPLFYFIFSPINLVTSFIP